jgi:Polysaccharide lyase
LDDRVTRLIRPQWTVVLAGLALVVFAAALLLYVNGSSQPRGATGPGTGPSEDVGAPADSGSAPVPSAPASPSRSPSASPVAPGTVLWRADTALGPRAFEGVETAPGTVTVVNDPQGRYGSSFRYETWQNPDGSKARCESRGMREPNGSVFPLDSAHVGQTFYLGWRALWSPLPTQTGAWIALFQMHVDGVGAGGLNVGPFVLRTLGDGQLHFQLISPDGSDRHIWNAPLPVNTWNSFVIGFRLSRGSDGWVQFWYDGVPQRFTNGATTYPAATLWGTHDNVKWGIYRSGANHTGNAVAYLNHAELGTSYAAVAP